MILSGMAFTDIWILWINGVNKMGHLQNCGMDFGASPWQI
jgi:hypothetical protein